MDKHFSVWFDHGFGDCVHFMYLLRQYVELGYSVDVHYEGNKSLLFEMAGVNYMPTPINYHKFDYPEDFNQPESSTPWRGNKIKYAMNRHGLPALGDIDEQWERLSKGPTFENITLHKDAENEAEAFLRDLPRPIVAFHGCGSNLGHMKNLSEEHQIEICRNLVELGASLVILDWDDRVPHFSHGRVRHLKSDWGHIDLQRLAALYKRLDLFIGVDSGPFHFARCFPLRTIGIWTGHHPACCTLRNDHAVNLVRRGHSTSLRMIRAEWNLIEYDDEMLPKVVSDVAAGFLERPELHPFPRAKEVALRALLKQTNGFAQTGCGHAWRERTFKRMLKEICNVPEPHIVETGCIRAQEDWSAGYSTYIFSFWIRGIGRGSLTSIDISNQNLEFANSVCDGVPRTICEDSVEALSRISVPIDLLYLDSTDVGVPGYEQHCLHEAVAGVIKLAPGGVIAIDDTWFDNGWRGKGALAIPWLISVGFTVVDAGYQTVLKRI